MIKLKNLFNILDDHVGLNLMFDHEYFLKDNQVENYDYMHDDQG